MYLNLNCLNNWNVVLTHAVAARNIETILPRHFCNLHLNYTRISPVRRGVQMTNTAISFEVFYQILKYEFA